VSLLKQEQQQQLAWQIIDRLEYEGYEAYLVGGCVRDQLLGRAIKDIDIATSALPETVLGSFKRAEPTGLQHGTITVILEGIPFEVTTFRSEQGYSDHRRPDEVRFIRDLREDLSRRDFTMNAMAIDRSGRLIDPFGGEHDLRQRVLRCVGEPQKRFAEDALRMLRCIRFAAEYELVIEQETWSALLANVTRIQDIAIERIRAELERIVEGTSPGRGLELLASSGITDYFKHSLSDIISAAVQVLRASQLTDWTYTDEPMIRWARLFLAAGLDAEVAGKLMRKLTFPNRKLQEIVQLITMHSVLWEQAQIVMAQRSKGLLREDSIEQPTMEKTWKLQVVKHGEEAALGWLAMTSARVDLDEQAKDWLRDAYRWLDELPIKRASELAIKGDHLLQAGFHAGPGLGKLLRYLAEAVAVGDLPNDLPSLMTESLRLQSVKSDYDE
jgi:tRNA nucleotidyltransferase (CCA-adding enzyme)